MRNHSPAFQIAAVAATLASAFTVADAGAATAVPDLECRLSVPARVASRASILLTFELVNRSKKATYNVLNWDTPLEGFYSPYLQITGPGGDVEYRGNVVKRGNTPTREEYVSIKAGQRITKTVNLAPAYDFKASGRHQITFSGKLSDATKEKIPRAWEFRTEMTVECPAVSFDLASR